MQVCNAGSRVPASLTDGSSSLTDLYISQGRIRQRQLSSACFTWSEVLRLAALELWRRGEADAARVTLKAGRQTVREFLRARFGIVTGAREFWHRENWTPDRADLQDLLAALRATRLVRVACANDDA
jgi:hypothetical protein